MKRKKPNTNSENCKPGMQGYIALIITILSASITLMIAIRAMFLKIDTPLDFVGQTLLPLIGTWMGAVLAYYFAKGQQDAAFVQQDKLIDKITLEKRLESMKVADVMIKFQEIKGLDFDEYYNDKKKTIIKDILQNEKLKDYNRFLFFQERKLKFIIHRSIFDRFISIKISETGVSKEQIEKLTLKDIIDSDDAKIRAYVHEGLEFLSANKNLYQAKLVMDSNKACEDIFITLSGKNEEEVLGWIPDTLLAEYSKV